MTTTNRVSLCGVLVSSPKPVGKRGRVEFEVAGFAKETNARDKFFHLVVRTKGEEMANRQQGDAVFIEGKLGDHRRGGVILAKTVKDYTGQPRTELRNGVEGLCNAHNKATLKGNVGQLEGELSQGYCRGTVATEGKTETVWHRVFFVRSAETTAAFDNLQTGHLVEMEGPILGTPKHHNLRVDRLQLLQSKGSPPPAAATSRQANTSQPPRRESAGCIAGLLSLLLAQGWRTTPAATLSKK